MRISDGSSDVCSSDLIDHSTGGPCVDFEEQPAAIFGTAELRVHNTVEREFSDNRCHEIFKRMARDDMLAARAELRAGRIFEHFRSEEHTSELQSLMRISYAVFCLKTKKQNHKTNT